jgi:FKBP-type peptidyl-prolyl cis-trans isomerase FklB
MKKLIILSISFCLTNVALAQNEQKSMDTLSYCVGILVGNNLAQQGLDEVEVTDLAIGLSDVLNKQELRVSLQEANDILTAYIQGKQAKQSATLIEQGQRFMEENGKRKGVITLESGLQYEVLVMGEGPRPGSKDKVTTHYEGKLLDETIFDSSYKRGQPASFPVNGVIAGWTEALQLMPVGSKWRLYIPPDLAYGERGAGDKIPPYSTLIFEVELLSID